jgi:excinuclease UvrABC ATPase subunit
MTYLGVFDRVRKLFARETGLPASRFSFNSDGACPKCKGLGTVSIELSFMDPIAMTCDQCEGRRYTPEVLAQRVNGLSIHDLLITTASDALGFFDAPAIKRPLEMMNTVGLGYLELGQPLSTLSGGESQRIKLSNELHKEGSIYILDEPTTGLHGADIAVLMSVLHRLADNGNTVIVIEHSIDVILQADWVIDMGPGGGREGGRVVAEGPPDSIARSQASHTGRFLRDRMRETG